MKIIFAQRISTNEAKSKVSVITLNWNKWEDTIECLEPLFDVTYQHCDVVVVDNGPEDDSLAKLKEYCKDKTRARPRYSVASGDKGQATIAEFTRSQADFAVDRIRRNTVRGGHSCTLILIENERITVLPEVTTMREEALGPSSQIA